MSARVRTPQPRTASTRAPERLLALAVFAVMAVGAPLFFGTVDRLPQIGLLVLLLIGILAQPPAVVPLSRWGNRLAIAFVALIILKEFAPAAWFGETAWRTVLTRQFALEMPATHHPEPGRAIEGILAGVVGVIWFLWVRRLAAERENRPVLAWILLGAVAIVAVVSFLTRNPASDAIYGLRYTPGWSGFGPFPNRNHSASLFAMGAVLGCGCLTWAWLRKKWWLFGFGVGLVAVIVVALLVTESRGGLLAFAVGLGAFFTLCLLKVRNRRALGAALGAALIFGAMGLAFGSQVFARFHSREGGDVSTFTRIQVWQDALGMWRDAPLLGHGVGAFASIFPLYQKIQLDNQIIIHPESSWLQWLTELGALPVILAVIAAALFLSGHLRESFSRHRSFFLRAGGFAAAAVLFAHAVIDVPAHRWGTAGFALAALAIACPMQLTGRRVQEARLTALVPLAVALLWMLPFLWDVPRWSPTSLIRLISRHAVPPGVPLAELEATLRWFPLHAVLHQSAGHRRFLLQGTEAPIAWQRHFAIATRLVPGSWDLPAAQARAVQRLSPIMALPYWQQAVSRGGIHIEEVLGNALQETGSSPVARAAWGRYAEAHPHLLLAYARLLPEAHAGYYYGRWWKQRAQVADLSPAEVHDFYALAARWGSREQLDEWMTRRAAWKARDFRQWAALLHTWGDDARAWELLAAHEAEPPFPSKAPTVPRAQLESTWRTSPENLVNAQQLAKVRDAAGDNAGRDEILLAVATTAKAPPWFIGKAAHLLARQGRVPEAVALLLRSR
jgi:O-antigen ligase